MTHTDVWWRRPWFLAAESAATHTALVILGLAMMVLGLGLSVTMIMLPVGLVIGLIGAGVVTSGLFARLDDTR